jgi:transposase-like protein
MLMPEIERLSDAIEWIDLSFVERQRTPNWAVYEAIRCHVAGMSLRDVSTHLEMWGISRSHVAVHNWVHAADLTPASTVTALQLAVDEKTIRINGRDYWLYAAVDPVTNEFLHVRLFPTTTNKTTRWSLADLHRRYQLDGVEFLVDDADSLVEVVRADGYDFQVMRHRPRNTIERVFREIQSRTSSFANSFSHVAPATAESWLEAFAVYHNTRQT